MGKVRLRIDRDSLKGIESGINDAKRKASASYQKISNLLNSIHEISNAAVHFLKSGTDLFKTLKKLVMDVMGYVPKVIIEYHFFKKLLTIGTGALVLIAVSLGLIAIVLLYYVYHLIF